MALQATFKNAKAYSPQNGNIGKGDVVKVKLGRNNKIIIRIPYNQDLINKIKIILGRKWNPEKKYSVRNADMNELYEIPAGNIKG